MVTVAVKRGRPSKEQAEKRHQALLSCAFEEFLANGFVAATIDAIADKMQMTKRTIYSRYPKKEDLFQACIEHVMLDTKITDDAYEACATDELYSTLYNLAKIRIDMYQGSSAVGLQKILAAEAGRFPQLMALNYRHDPAKAREHVQRQLNKFKERGAIQTTDTYLAAELFLGIAVGSIVAELNSGALNNDQASIKKRLDFSIELFLHGVQC